MIELQKMLNNWIPSTPTRNVISFMNVPLSTTNYTFF